MARLSRPQRLGLPPSRPLARPWRWTGRPCTFPGPPNRLRAPAAVGIVPAAATADPAADPHRPDRPERRKRRRLPPLWLQPRYRRPKLGMICAILEQQAPPLADAAGLWREQSAELSAACGRGSGKAKRRGKEGHAGTQRAAEPSSRPAGARNGRSPCAVD